ncbi:MAG: acyl-CoA thioesterase [Verrucomicrobia bacterium]|nr:acyl-CoA thioesterase [Kiritimatiellia bacterium]MCB1102793.1 acyl-CoA thioesterase [Kiritimatiellia bacterium]MCP5487911.1 acyl-CoA thioesterase [Verrucomicrobiota bacterium]
MPGDVPGIYRVTFTVTPDMIDENRHMNNVAYVQWMQDIAIEHFSAMGGMADMEREHAAWVARSHHIEYLSPAFLGEQIELATWVSNLRRVRSIRRYQFTHVASNKLIGEGQTEWIYIDRETGRPKSVPGSLASKFILRDL